jgi:hypothetical protein
MIRGLTISILGAAALAAPVGAEIRAASPQGFTSEIVVTTKADPATAWKRFLEPQHWWSSAHTYSQDARNLRMEAKPGATARSCRTAGASSMARSCC